MEIRDLKIYCLSIPLPKPGLKPAWRQNIPEISTDIWVVELETEDHKGIGVGLTLTQGEKKLLEKYLRMFLIGFDPFNVGRISELFRSASFLGSRIFPVELALWDLIGKECNKPLYKLFGGYRDRVRAYVSTAELKKPEERLKDVEKWMEQGYKAIKLRAHSLRIEDDIEVVRAVRDLVGNEMEIMVDANQAWGFTEPIWNFSTALRFAKECEKLEVLWLEEPLHRDALEDLKELRSKVDLMLAGGELDAGGIRKFRIYLEEGIYDILQPDLVLSSGFGDAYKIATLAEAYGKLCIPHTWTTGFGLAATLQLSGSVPNCPWIEFPCEPPVWSIEQRDLILKEPIRIDSKGYLRIPEKPGIGVELNEDILERYKVE